MTDLLFGTAGCILLVVTAADIFRSLLVPRASSAVLRVGPALTMALFPLWQASTNRIAGLRLRQTIRACLAPLMLVLNLVVWAALLIVGFGLIFWADRAHFAPEFKTLADALYAAGSAFSTLGINGKVEGDFTRIAVLICSVAGLATVTVVSTFLISIQAGFSRRETIVLRLESHVTLPPAGIAILETYAEEAIIGRLGPFFESWELWATEVAISHRAFPILLFFRSNDSRCEWLAAFGAVLDAAALLDASVSDPLPEARAGAHFVLRTGARMLGDMADQFATAHQQQAETTDRERFRSHRARMEKAGYTLFADESRTFERYRKLRQSYATSLAALGRRLQIDVDERTANDEDSEPQR
ncbi:hypothetical protein [Sphingomonas sp. BAUL-RG-20F-R05-02]|uniref:hypothetical protein n=1 Tax=Sphingomonas sp. BAUL-RG-20F-R05-02 TaxID=2914830 RepID=UPI001F5A7B78|nr:hypothetical protein [Sphingomonas sp. BAUL-RG-20F-R05-02]